MQKTATGLSLDFLSNEVFILSINGIYISGFFSKDDKEMLDTYAAQLSSKGIPFYVRNLTGSMMQSALDFTDYEVLAIAHEVLKQFLLSGGYDITKHYLKLLWKNITKDRYSGVPFTISIDGIPTSNGKQTIKCKVTDSLSDEEKEKVLDKAFALASQIENHQYQLMKKSQYYDALGGHLFKYDFQNSKLCEIDVEEEIRKKTYEE